MSAMQTRTVAGLLLLRDRAVGLADLGAAFPQYDSRAGFYFISFFGSCIGYGQRLAQVFVHLFHVSLVSLYCCDIGPSRSRVPQ